MNERELLVDCLRRLNRSGVIYYLTGSIASNYWGATKRDAELNTPDARPGFHRI